MIVAASFQLDDANMINNRGLQYGDGLFETMRMCQGDIPLFKWHMNRLAKGLQKLDLKPIDVSELQQRIEQASDTTGSANCVLKLVVFRAGQQRGYAPKTSDVEWFLTLDQWHNTASRKTIELAVAKQKLPNQPILAGIKHLSRLEQVLLAAELSKHPGVDDLLVLNHKNHIIETTHQNVVFIKNDLLFTPNLQQCGVKGVALKWLKSKHNIKRKNIKINEVHQFDGLMVCNSIRGFRAVKSIHGLPSKDVISFSTSLPIQDKISNHWEALFNS